MFKRLVTATAFSILSLTAAQATTITSVNTTGSAVPVNLNDSLILPTGAAWDVSGTPASVTGSASGLYLSPIDDGAAGGLDETTSYWNLTGGNTGIMDFTGTHTSLSFLWGSVDTYNAVEFWLNGNVVATIISAMLVPAPTPGTSGGASFVTVAGLTFDEVHFTTTGNSFEFMGVSAAVPLPAGGLLLIGAIGGLAALRRRKAV